MSENVKFTVEELKTIEDIQKEYATLQIKFGQIGFAKMRIENEIQNINKAEQDIKDNFLDVQKKEEKFLNGVTKKYGEGYLDPNTGIFNTNKTTK